MQLRALAEQLSGEEYIKLREAADGYDRMAEKIGDASQKATAPNPKSDGAASAQE